MAPTTDYKIVLAPTTELLAEEVKKEIKNGWQVYGGFTVVGNMPAQALIKTENLLATISSALSTANSSLSSIKTSTASIDKKTPELD